MNNFLYIIIITLLLSCVNNQNDELTLISSSESVKKIQEGTLDYSYAVFKNQKGELISDEERKLLNAGKLMMDFYEDSKGKIVEVRLRVFSLEGKFIDIQRKSSLVNPLKFIELTEIDCNGLDSIFAEVQKTDQSVRIEGGDMEFVDSINQQIVVSVIEQCGWSEEYLSTIWLVFQHSPKELMGNYYPELKKLSLQGKLKLGSMALMEDRLLMGYGYNQIYGSQISNGILYDLDDPHNVNQRRASMDLGPIEEYISRWDLNFTEEVKRMQIEGVFD